jgi:F0F1-type ATP synthase membrane subunit b/b'
MAKRAKASEPSEPEAEIVKADEPVVDPPSETDARPALPPPALEAPRGTTFTTPTSEPARPPAAVPSGPTFSQRVGRFFAFLLRLVTLVILLSLLSLALYLTLPWLYQKFIRPVEQNTAQVRELQSRQQQMEQHLADLQTKLGTIESVQNQHDGTLTKLDKRLSDIETEITARTESLTTLEKMQTQLQAQNEANSAELDRQINLLKGMELLSRARLFMYQSNFGLARQDVQIARDLLAEVQPGAAKPSAEELDAVVQRLDMVLSNLPDFPVAASDDLDIAWQILLAGLPQATPTLSETPTPAGTLSATPTGNATFTLTPQATVKPSATP